MKKRQAIMVAALVVTAVVVPVGANASTREAPAINWTACGPRLECASVAVPLDWRHPGGPTIALAVARHVASRPDQRIGSLFVNPGGPGDSGVAMVTGRGDALDAQTGGRFDIVGWDPRGAGGSAPVSCFADPAERASLWQDQPGPPPAGTSGATWPRPSSWRSGAAPATASCWPTSPPPTRSGTWTTCGSWWATAGSPSWASRPGRSSA